MEGIDLQSSNMMMVARALVTFDIYILCMMNPTDQPVTLYKGTRIACLMEAKEVDGSVLVSTVQQDNTSSDLETAL